jgi:hypothetical protein
MNVFMVMLRYVLFALYLTTSLAQAEEKKLDGNAITAALSDKTLAGTDGDKQWRQLFQKGGVTVYTVDGNASNGHWEVRGDQYCSQWPPNESWSCYDMTINGKTIIFISSSGKRYPGVAME